MTIVFLCRLYYPHVGGVEKHVREISKILSTKHKIIIITEQHDLTLPLEETYPEAKVYRIPIANYSEKNKKWAIWHWVWCNRQLFNTAKIIHVHDVFFWVLPLLPFRLLHSSKYFITFHGYEGANPPNFKQIVWHKIGEWFTRGNICIGNFYTKWYHTKPTQVSFGATDIKSKPVGKNGKAIFVGRLDLDTGIMDYLKAAGHLKLHLDVYGDGPLLTRCQEFTRSNNINATFHGFDSQAASYISSYSYAFISRYLGIIESLVSKTITFSHYDSEIKYDYLTQTPFSNWIFICGSSQEIVSHVRNYQNHPSQYQPMIEEGYNWAKGQTWAKLAGDYESLWQK
jgi:glycosyltransferase involved in cell wall biosynthesis